MKESIRIRLLLILILTLLISCLKDSEGSNPELIIDPAEYEFWVSWKEIERRTDSEFWQTIDSGDTLKLSLNYVDASKKDLGGTYNYALKNLNIDLDKLGDVKLRESDISFIPLSAIKDSINLPIQLIQNENDTLLVIRNTLSTPITEVKYERVEFKQHPY